MRLLVNHMQGKIYINVYFHRRTSTTVMYSFLLFVYIYARWGIFTIICFYSLVLLRRFFFLHRFSCPG